MKKITYPFLILILLINLSCSKESRFAIDTEDPIEVSACRATFKATGKNGGSKKITEKGFCYSTTGNPTISDNPTPSTNGFVDLFEAEATGLKANTSYQIRAYTKFSDGSVVMGDLNEFTTNGVYMVGDIGPNNGIIISANQASTSNKYLEAIVTNMPSYGWGCSSNAINGTSMVGSGLSNSILIKSNCGSNTAAAYCLDLSVNGVTGWYLPSITELSSLYNTSKSYPDLIPSGRYWSSSQINANEAYSVDLGSNSEWKTTSKSTSLRVVAVKGFN